MTKEVCIIGAGASGLVSIKECLEAGFSPTCFDRAGWTGGLWRYHEEDSDGLSSVARSTIINSSKEQSALSDFPPGRDVPNYCHNVQFIKYLDDYTENFGLKKYIHLRHEIIKVTQEPTKNKQWSVLVKDLDKNEEKQLSFDAVMICTGHHVKPLIPKFPGQEKFQGKIIHTHSYKRPNGFEDKNICVVGIGNSGGDAAAELSTVSKKCYLSTRRGSWVTHRVGPFGLPTDLFYTRRVHDFLFSFLPPYARSDVMESTLNSRFDHEAYGLKPKHRFAQQHPMVNDTLPNRIISGVVIVKANIKTFTENGVIFEGDTEETPLDIVVLATGYEMYFPFLDKSIIDPKENEVELYKYVFSPRIPSPETLAFIGFIQPVGALIPISEQQARWVCQLLLGRVHLPSKNDMLIDIENKRLEIKNRYYKGSRHTIQVDWLPFMDEIADQFGAKPNLQKIFLTDPALWFKMFFGPTTPYHYRINGPGAWKGARNAIMTLDDRLKGGTSLGRKGNLFTDNTAKDMTLSEKLGAAVADVSAVAPYLGRAAVVFVPFFILLMVAYHIFFWFLSFIF